jgi:hypothetical protein
MLAVPERAVALIPAAPERAATVLRPTSPIVVMIASALMAFAFF